MEFCTPLRQVKGVGEKTEQLFQNLGVYTVGDILLHFPRTYEEFSEPLQATEEYSCLLYTSPSPRDLARSRMPSSA